MIRHIHHLLIQFFAQNHGLVAVFGILIPPLCLRHFAVFHSHDDGRRPVHQCLHTCIVHLFVSLIGHFVDGLQTGFHIFFRPAVQLPHFGHGKVDIVVGHTDPVCLTGGFRFSLVGFLFCRRLSRRGEGLYGSRILPAVFHHEELIAVGSSRRQRNSQLTLDVIPHVKPALRSVTVLHVFFDLIPRCVLEDTAHLSDLSAVGIVHFG